MYKLLVTSCLLLASADIRAEPLSSCVNETDDQLRLACYDLQSGRTRALSAAPATKAADPAAKATAVRGGTPGAASAAAEAPRTALAAAGADGVPSAMSQAWELDENDKRSTFILRTFQPNLLLPIHYTSSINRSPHSPTHPVSAINPEYRPLEAKLQISLRTKVAEDLLLPGANLWLAYTQQSQMQAFDHADSSPFRSSDYQPEAIYVVPVPARIGQLPMGWTLRMMQLGFAHQSNGQSDPLSRSWNLIYLGAGLEHGDFSLQLRANQRLEVDGKDDNPDLVNYLGRAEVALAWAPGRSLFNLVWRTSFDTAQRGSLRLDWSRPVFADKPAGLRWYVQLFSGYGETLLDYNHRQTSLGLGLALFQF